MRFLLLLLLLTPILSKAQEAPATEAELKKQILELNERVDQVQLNLVTSEKKIQTRNFSGNHWIHTDNYGWLNAWPIE